MNHIIKITLILAIVSITGCYYDTEERLYPALYDPCADKDVTFSQTVSTILQPCLSCHSNSAVSRGEGGGTKLENYADIKTLVTNGKLMGSIRHDDGFIPMPQTGGKLPQCQIDQLQKWIDNLTPDN